MPFLEKIADITVLGRHVGNMSATFPAKADSFGGGTGVVRGSGAE